MIELLSVARVLTLIATAPNARTVPRPTDPKGRFDVWFDGGAAKHDTGISTYLFDDGTEATTGSGLPNSVRIVFPGGAAAVVREERK